MSEWHRYQLTSGTEQSRYHTHSYYDIHVFDSQSRRIVGHSVDFAERSPTPEDSVEVGVIDLERDAAWIPVGESRAWSWQQGPMAQWLPGRPVLLWNDRDQDRFVTRVHDLEADHTSTLPLPSYAVDPNARFTLSLNMARLDTLRPGYGYSGGHGARLRQPRPADDGVWRQDLPDGETTLVLSLDRAVKFLLSHMSWRHYVRNFIGRYRYWFNHVKLSPDGQRFTVKLRYRPRDLDQGWSERLGVSLTCNVDGSDLRLLVDATSHVIWFDNETLYLWRRDGFYFYADRAPTGECLRPIAPGLLEHNAHVRYMPGTPSCFIFDTPYREDIDLRMYDEAQASVNTLARFANHRPTSGPFRCDLHACPSPDGRKIVLTSLDDGGRQIYLLA